MQFRLLPLHAFAKTSRSGAYLKPVNGPDLNRESVSAARRAWHDGQFLADPTIVKPALLPKSFPQPLQTPTAEKQSLQTGSCV